MKTVTKTIDYFLNNDVTPPIPLEIIPDRMGINLRSVESLTWTKLDDGQFVNLTINFIPEVNYKEETYFPRPGFLGQVEPQLKKGPIEVMEYLADEIGKHLTVIGCGFTQRASENNGWVIFEPKEN